MFFVRNEGEWCNMHAEARRTLPADRNTSLCSVVLSLLMPMVLVHDQVGNPLPEIPPCSAYFSEMPMICLDFLERDGGTPKTLLWFELGRQAPQAPYPLNRTELRWLFLAHFLLQPVQCWSSVWLWALRHMTEWLSMTFIEAVQCLRCPRAVFNVHLQLLLIACLRSINKMCFYFWLF